VKRWQAGLLIVSLIANIFLVGAIVGGVWRWTHNPGIGLRGEWRKRAADALPQQQADQLRDTIRSAVRANLGIAHQARAARAEAARLFVQPQFDAAAVDARLDQARAADSLFRANLEHALVQFSSTLPQDQRQKMAEALKQGPFRQGPFHHPPPH
jgi:uncharacterized membrane protein